nr:transposase [Hyalangium gracile]
MERRKRRSFTPEFRAEAVRLVREGTKSLPQVAKDLDLTESALRLWVKQADSGQAQSAQARQDDEYQLLSLRRWNGDHRREVTHVEQRVYVMFLG